MSTPEGPETPGEPVVPSEAPAPTVAPHHEELPEGVEAAPPGTKLMAIVRWAIVVLMATAALVSILHVSGKLPRSLTGQKAAKWFCPMHPGVIQDTPGECPICGMSLVQEGATAAPVTPVSGKLTTVAPNAPFFCEMHPEHGSDDANARCALCGMKLTPRAKGAPSASASGLSPASSGVPGLSTIDLSADRLQLMGMKTERARKEKLATTIKAVASIAATEGGVAKVHARTSGWIEELLVSQTGTSVKAGQTLAILYSPEVLLAQQELLKAKSWSTDATLSSLADDARKRLGLLGVSSWEIEAVEKSGKPSKTLGVRATIGGIISKKSAFKGLYVQPGTELFEIVDLSKVWVLADLYEHDVARVKLGQAGVLTLPAYPGETFRGEVSFVFPTMNAETRTVRVRLELANKDGRLRPGMFGDVEMSLPAAEAVVVPTEAVVDTGEATYVYLAKGAGTFEPRSVKVGARTGEWVQILSGIADGDIVVTTGNFLLDSESRLHTALSASGKAK